MINDSLKKHGWKLDLKIPLGKQEIYSHKDYPRHYMHVANGEDVTHIHNDRIVGGSTPRGIDIYLNRFHKQKNEEGEGAPVANGSVGDLGVIPRPAFGLVTYGKKKRKERLKTTNEKLNHLLESQKFSFRRNIPTGKYRTFEPESHEIKHQGKVVGTIKQLRGGFTNSEDEGKHQIGFAVKKASSEQSPAGFKWVFLKQKFDTSDDAKNFIHRNTDKLHKQLDFHYFED